MNATEGKVFFLFLSKGLQHAFIQNNRVMQNIYTNAGEPSTVFDPEIIYINIRTYRIYRADIYPSPTSGEAYRDRQLNLNFEFWVEIFCVPTCFHMRIPKSCLSVRLSVRTPRKKILLASSILVLH